MGRMVIKFIKINSLYKKLKLFLKLEIEITTTIRNGRCPQCVLFKP